ncbi:MAG TPA: pilus assembly protein TadG-related protein [Xanthobacteraceae bacterium]|nr:pilus assembly protein TadG-related protein [Xanthobacteraceae bacterium]
MPRRLSFRAFRLRKFLRDERGSIAVTGASFAVCAIGVLALGVDVAAVFVERRRAQSAVDLAAIAAARDPDKALQAATATVRDNGVFGVRNIRIVKGTYTADPAIPVNARFVPNATPVNAVMVELDSKAAAFFGRSLLPDGTMDVATRATAVSTAQAAFTIGSRLLSIDGGVLNAFLSGLLGGNVSLTIMDYNALAGFNVDLFKFSNALGTSVVGQAGTYQDLAAARVSAGQVLDAMISVAQGSGAGAQVDFALRQLKNYSNANNVKLYVNKLIDFGQSNSLGFGQAAAALQAKVTALSLIQAVAEVANGKNQVDITSNLTVPGLLGAQLGITIGERPQSSPWIRFGANGIEVYTAQTRVRLITEVGGSGLLSGITLRVPVYLDIAAARARLADISCGPNPASDLRVTLGVRPSVLNAWIAEPASLSGWKTLGSPPHMLNASIANVAALITATGKANAEITNMSDVNVVFRYADIANLTSKNVKTAHFTQSLTASLVNNLSLTVSAGGLLSLTPTGVLTALIRSILSPVTPMIDGVLNNVLKALGIGIGEADVWVNGVRCDGAALVR